MIFRRPIKHCRECGAAVTYRLPDDGDTRARAICPACNTIHYENPLMVVGTVPVLGERVLLCKRNIEPRWGKWTLPAGFMELGETAEQGAARETDEEAGALITMGPLFSLLSVPQVGQVHIFYLRRCSASASTPATRRWRRGSLPRTKSPGTRSPFGPSSARWNAFLPTAAAGSSACTPTTFFSDRD